MKRIFTHALVVARRDFLATVATPTFLVFLLMPFVMVGLSIGFGTGVASMATKPAEATRIVAFAAGDAAVRLKTADDATRQVFREGEKPPPLEILVPAGDAVTQANEALKSGSTTAVMFGPLARPHIVYSPPSDRHARYLAALAEQGVRGARAGLGETDTASRPVIVAAQGPAPEKAARSASGFGAVMGIFFLTLLLAGQAVGMLAEEKSNKVIEILAAAVPLESVFLGKLLGMFGSALVFVTFWGMVLGIASLFLPPEAGFANLKPAIGLPIFLALCGGYFAMAYMLLGAIFLGIGALASSMREIQMMSLPITVFQMGMFGLSSAAAGNPGSGIARFAQIFPFSSPFAMAARGATDAALWPHLLALGWQALWVGLTIIFAARLFRLGVLKSGGGWRAVLGVR